MKLLQLLNDIEEQATRMNKSSDLKRYLVTDLEIIEKKVKEAKVELKNHGVIGDAIQRLDWKSIDSPPVRGKENKER